MVGHATRRVVNLRERVEVRTSGHELRCAAVAIAAEIRAREHHHEGLLREVFLRGRDGAAPPLKVVPLTSARPEPNARMVWYSSMVCKG